MIFRVAGCMGSALALTFCMSSVANAEHVKDIQADKFAYLQKKFSPESVNRSVLTKISKADLRTLNFRKMVFAVKDQITITQTSGTPPNYVSTWTYINVGGPFLNLLSENSSNGFPVNQDYFLDYRGLLAIEIQDVTLSAMDAHPALTMKNLKAFESLVMPGPVGGEFEWQYQVAPHDQYVNFRDTFLHCKYGAEYSASNINPKLTGNAQDLNCEVRNYNNVAILHSIYVLLLDYGFTVMKQVVSANSTVDYTIQDVQIE